VHRGQPAEGAQRRRGQEREANLLGSEVRERIEESRQKVHCILEDRSAWQT
jgi:hypothetical protein